MTPDWTRNAFVYHIYPLGLCDAPAKNDFQSAPVERLNRLYDWIPHIQNLGANTIYIGPLFESTAHGYDTADYFQLDRRLGTNETLKNLITVMKQHGMRVIFDAVFNHVGRDFYAFQDVIEHKQASAYCDWFLNLNFEQSSPYGDHFSYEGWAGHYDLVKLNLDNPAVRQHIFDAIAFWIDYFEIDGLRLDAADVMSPDFFRALRQHCQAKKPDFWLMGEIVHGDYNQLANSEMLHSTTNYEVYKGLYSSHVDCNLFEIAYSLNRQFGENGLYKDLLLYNFADNHDVNRVASNLDNPAHLYTLYGLMFTILGIPSIYYGSEWGITGKRTATNDRMLRPALSLHDIQPPHPDLYHAIQCFAKLRSELPALRYGNYRQLSIVHEQFAFERITESQHIIVLINISSQPAHITLENIPGKQLIDRLNGNEVVAIQEKGMQIEVYKNWLRVLEVPHEHI